MDDDIFNQKLADGSPMFSQNQINGKPTYSCHLCNALNLPTKKALLVHVAGKRHRENLHPGNDNAGSDPSEEELPDGEGSSKLILQINMDDDIFNQKLADGSPMFTIQVNEKTGKPTYSCHLCNALNLPTKKALLVHVAGKRHRENLHPGNDNAGSDPRMPNIPSSSSFRPLGSVRELACQSEKTFKDSDTIEERSRSPSDDRKKRFRQDRSTSRSRYSESPGRSRSKENSRRSSCVEVDNDVPELKPSAPVNTEIRSDLAKIITEMRMESGNAALSEDELSEIIDECIQTLETEKLDF